MSPYWPKTANSKGAKRGGQAEKRDMPPSSLPHIAIKRG